MISDTGLIIVSIISLIGMLGVFMINNSNWFKRENFKLQKSNILNENRIKMKKLEKELGLKPSKTPVEHETPPIMDLIKGLDADKIGGILEMLQNNEEEPGEKSDIMSLIDKIPPEAIQGILEGLNKNKEGAQDGHYQF